jgi:hypothetical protein
LSKGLNIQTPPPADAVQKFNCNAPHGGSNRSSRSIAGALFKPKARRKAIPFLGPGNLFEEEKTMAELKQDPTHPLKHEQCYLCFMTLVESPPANAPSREELRRPHKEYMARLESEGRLFAAGLLKNDKDNETTCDVHPAR